MSYAQLSFVKNNSYFLPNMLREKIEYTLLEFVVILLRTRTQSI
jgi:hypothetical protein